MIFDKKSCINFEKNKNNNKKSEFFPLGQIQAGSGFGAKLSGSATLHSNQSGSGCSPDPGQLNHQIDFKTSFKVKKKLLIFKSEPKQRD